jgi:choline dehydrogenase-like flavoprotein
LADGRKVKASKEIILSAGAVDSPKILLHSGIGPRDALAKLGIPPGEIHGNEHVGRHLRDHYHVVMVFGTDEEPSTRPTPPATGGHAMGFFKIDNALQSPEFDELPEDVKRHLTAPTVPTWEVVHRRGGPITTPGISGLAVYVIPFILTGQGEGEVALQSLDPAVPPSIRMSYLEHPWDKLVVVEATRECLRIMDHPGTFRSKKEGMPHVLPRSDGEEDILEFWRQNVASTWHMTSSCRIGKTAEDGVCDKDFKVFGVRGLRVADMSVTPLLPR